MAHGDGASRFQEIKYSDIEFGNVVNSGTFGVVKEAYWLGQRVAVKTMEAEEEKKAFRNELKQLSRIHHENIVKLFGAVSDGSKACLVMEFADGGSLYDVLHNENHVIRYTTAHGLSWMLQCARGVEYLHGIKLVHRDLKSPNLLLIHPGTTLKICDFGTACEARTHMTNCTGSAAWMAPEVFEDTNYSEKCDVYSFGIILWEVLSGRKPFSDISGGAFAIMWKVHEGVRPQPIHGVPDILQDMMTRCWHQSPKERPSFSKLCVQLEYLVSFFRGEEKHPVVDDGQQDVQAGPLDTEGAETQVPANSSSSSTPASMGALLQVGQAMDEMNLRGTHSSTVSNEGKEQALAALHQSAESTRTSTSTVSSSSSSSTKGGSILNSLRRMGVSPCGSTDGHAHSVPYPGLDAQLQPLPPAADSAASEELYKEHCRLADAFLDVRKRTLAAHRDSAEQDQLLLQDKQDGEQGLLRLRRFKDLLEEKERLTSKHKDLAAEIQLYEG